MLEILHIWFYIYLMTRLISYLNKIHVVHSWCQYTMALYSTQKNLLRHTLFRAVMHRWELQHKAGMLLFELLYTCADRYVFYIFWYIYILGYACIWPTANHNETLQSETRVYLLRCTIMLRISGRYHCLRDNHVGRSRSHDFWLLDLTCWYAFEIIHVFNFNHIRHIM